MELASMMVGREVKLTVAKEKAHPVRYCSRLQGLTVEDTVESSG